MGQIVNVVEKPSAANPGVVRFETNRVLSGTGHDRFRAGDLVDGDRPVDELARRLFVRGGVAAVHVNGGVVTVDLEKGYDAAGLADIIRGLYTYYVVEDAPAPEVDAEADVAGQPETHGESVAAPEDTAVEEADPAEPEAEGEAAEAPAEDATEPVAEGEAAEAPAVEVSAEDEAAEAAPVEAEGDAAEAPTEDAAEPEA